MSIKFHDQRLFSESCSKQRFSVNSEKIQSCWNKTHELDCLRVNWSNCKKGSSIKSAYFKNRKYYLVLRKSRRIHQFLPLASADKRASVNGSLQPSTSTEVKDTRVKLNQSVQGDDYNDGLLQVLHDAARVFEHALKEKGSPSKLSWFSTAWLGIDSNAWVKTLSYQAAVYSLLEAANQISLRGDSRERDTSVFVQKSLLQQSAHLESLIREKLSANQSEAYDWFWSEKVPEAVSSFIAHFEIEQRFPAAGAVPSRGTALGTGNASDTSLVILALTCIAAIMKLGPAKVFCPHLFSTIPDIAGRLMDMLVDFVPIDKAYRTITDIGLQREFLVHFGPRAAACRLKNDSASEEVAFWVNLVQNQLQKSVAREKIWSRLTTSESIEVLERDLSIFGFFIALGRSSQSFLSVNGFDEIEEPVESFIRHLIGGSVLYYPELSAISSYQLYVEVVCEELDWLPFYPGIGAASKKPHGHGSEREAPPNIEAIPEFLDVCFHWIQSFINYSQWAENPSNVKAARFLSRGHKILIACMEELRISKTDKTETVFIGRSESPIDKEADSFDKALEGVEEALKRLEKLLQEAHVSSSDSGKEQLKAACSDLEKIRKLKKEAEFFEVSFRAKAASLQQDSDDDDGNYQSAGDKHLLKGKNRKRAILLDDKSKRSKSKSRGLLSVLLRSPLKKPESKASVETSGDQLFDEDVSIAGFKETQPSEILRFEALRNELVELEKRVQRSAEESQFEGDNMDIEVLPDSIYNSGLTQLVKVEKKANIIEKSLDKLKEASTDVLQGTQLLAIDVGAAMGLLRRTLIGDELTEKEKRALQRTLTDLASVVPISVLMLLPVTAVGHAAMLAAIQRYVPALIPSTYGPERLNLLRQLEKMKKVEATEVDPEEAADEQTQ